MERVAGPLRRMGADVRTRNGRPPLAITGGRKLHGCAHQLDVPSAQVKSAILLAGLGAAIEYLERVGVKEIHEHVRELTTHAIEKLEGISGVRVLA